MQLPFTREQLFDLFVAYNEALWPAAVALWIASTVVALRLSARHQHDLGPAPKTFEPDDVAAGRAYVKAYVAFIHFVELLYDSTMKMPNRHSEEREAPAKHR